MPGWLEALTAHERAGTPAVLVTLVELRGSAPREAGAKLVVTAAALEGSIGGGALEHSCAEIARGLLAQGVCAPSLRDFPLGPALGQCCGGHVRVLFEPLFTRVWDVALFGAGHVGQAVAGLLGALPCRLHWIDQRADVFPAELPPHVQALPCAEPQAEVARLAARISVVVMTHDHALDYRIVAACLRREDLRFVGLIGSETKAARFRSRLARDGFGPEAIARVTCPVGLPGIGGKLPTEIAVSVVAQLLQARDAVPARPAAVTVPPALSVACGETCAACAVDA